MASSLWQKQHIHFQKIIWGVAAAIAVVTILILSALGFSLEVSGVFFILVFVILRIVLAFIFNNRYANSMVRILNFGYEEIEREFRIVFKNNNIRFFRKSEEDTYRYEFPGRNLSMTVQPYWLSQDNEQPATKLTLYELSPKNEEFAELLAGSIDEMANQRASIENEK